MAKVSVIITFFNQENYVKRLLDIVINQTLKDIEIIIVDDYSYDNTVKLIKEYAQKDNRIKTIFHQENKSLFQTRKNGVSISTGDYIMFIDGDDEIYPYTIEKAYNAIKEHQVDILHFKSEIISYTDKNTTTNMQIALEPYLSLLKSDDNLIKFCKWNINGNFYWTLWNKIYKGDLIRKALAKTKDVYRNYLEDLYISFFILYYAKSYYGIEDVLYKYNFGLGMTGQNTISLKNYKSHIDTKILVEDLRDFLEAEGVKEKYKNYLKYLDEMCFGDCFFNWKLHLENSKISEGFELLVNTFGLEKVLDFLAQSYWNIAQDEQPLRKIGDLLNQVEFFNYKKRKVQNIALYYFKLYNGGAERVVALLCNRLSQMKDKNGDYIYNVICITDDKANPKDYELNQRVKRAFLPNIQNSWGENFKYRYQSWKKIITDYNIDIVVSSLYFHPITYWDILAVKGQPSKPAFIIHNHNFVALPFLLTDNTIKQNYLYETCDGLVALSESDELYLSAFNNNVKYIVNPIDFKPKEIPISTYYNNTILWIGRISYEKQPLDVIEMMRYVVEEITDAKLLIVGKDLQELENNMHSLIREYKLEDNIKMLGFTQDVAYYYGLASVLVSTSKYEGFPLVLGEAMAFALPIVAYDMPWLSFIRDGRGILTVPQRNYEQLAQKVIELLKNPEKIKRIGLEGKRQITEISQKNIEKDWKDFFDNLPERKTVPKLSLENILFKYLTLYHQESKDKLQNTVIENLNLNAQNKDLDYILGELNAVKNGYSFRIGRVITYIPRKVRDTIRCYKEKGLKYTIRRIIEHLGIDMGTGNFRK